MEETVNAEDAAQCKQAGVQLIGLSELKALGQANPAKPNAPTPQDMAMIMYTSGE